MIHEEQKALLATTMMFQIIMAKLDGMETKLSKPESDMTLGELVKGYIQLITEGAPGKKRHRKPENYAYLLKVLLEAFDPEMRICDLTAQALEDFLYQNWRASSLKQRKAQLSGMFNWGIKTQKKLGRPVFENPCELIECESKAIARPDFIPIETLAPLLKGLDLETWLLFAIPLSGGLRVSEALKLRPCDITDGRVLTLHLPKSGREKEVAMIPLPVAEKLEAYIDEREIKDDAAIFWMSRQAANNRITRHCLKHELSLSIHALRKWCATFWSRLDDPGMSQFALRHAGHGLGDRYVAPLSIKEALERQDRSLAPLFEKGGPFWR